MELRHGRESDRRQPSESDDEGHPFVETGGETRIEEHTNRSEPGHVYRPGGWGSHRVLGDPDVDDGKRQHYVEPEPPCSPGMAFRGISYSM